MEVLIKVALIEDKDSIFFLPLTNSFKSYDLIKDEPFKLESMNISQDEYSSEKSPIEIKESIQEDLSNLRLLEDMKAEIQEGAYQEGYQAGLVEVKEKYNSQFEQLSSLLVNINDALPEYLKKSESMIAVIVFESLCKIIGQVLADKSRAMDVVANVIRGLEKEKIREIYISQIDFDTIDNLGSDLAADKVALENYMDQFTFKIDPEIRLGGCKVKLVDGFLDATIERQLNILSKSLAKKADELAL